MSFPLRPAVSSNVETSKLQLLGKTFCITVHKPVHEMQLGSFTHCGQLVHERSGKEGSVILPWNTTK